MGLSNIVVMDNGLTMAVGRFLLFFFLLVFLSIFFSSSSSRRIIRGSI